MTYREIGISIHSLTMLHSLHFAQKRGSCSEMQVGRSKKIRWTAVIVIRCGMEKTRYICIQICSAA